MRVETPILTDKSTIVVEKPPGGKIRATSMSFDGDKTTLPDEVLEIRNMNGRLRIARKRRLNDDDDPAVDAEVTTSRYPTGDDVTQSNASPTASSTAA